jgi:hypothetical protein
MKAGGEVSKYKNTPVPSSAAVERFFSEYFRYILRYLVSPLSD